MCYGGYALALSQLETSLKPVGNQMETIWTPVGNKLETTCKPVNKTTLIA